MSKARPVWFPAEVLGSPAVHALRGAALHVLMIFYSRRWGTKVKNLQTRTKEWVPANDKTLEFPYRQALKMGFTLSRFNRAKDELLRVGFLDITHQGGGLLGDRSTYALSERWRDFGLPAFREVKRPRARRIGFLKAHTESIAGKSGEPHTESIAGEDKPSEKTQHTRSRAGAHTESIAGEGGARIRDRERVEKAAPDVTPSADGASGDFEPETPNAPGAYEIACDHINTTPPTAASAQLAAIKPGQLSTQRQKESGCGRKKLGSVPPYLALSVMESYQAALDEGALRIFGERYHSARGLKALDAVVTLAGAFGAVLGGDTEKVLGLMAFLPGQLKDYFEATGVCPDVVRPTDFAGRGFMDYMLEKVSPARAQASTSGKD